MKALFAVATARQPSVIFIDEVFNNISHCSSTTQVYISDVLVFLMKIGVRYLELYLANFMLNVIIFCCDVIFLTKNVMNGTKSITSVVLH